MSMTFATPSTASRDCFGGVARPSYNRSDFDLQALTKHVLDAASRFAVNAVFDSCAAEPVAFWRSALEPALPMADFQAVYNVYRDRDGLVAVDEFDMPLPVYCARASEALDYYDSLEDDWDGEGALAPSKTSTRDARYFLRILSNQIADAPEVRPMIDSDGVPGFFWSNERKYLSMSFYGDFSLTFVYRDKSEVDFISRTVLLDDAKEIADILAYVEVI